EIKTQLIGIRVDTPQLEQCASYFASLEINREHVLAIRRQSPCPDGLARTRHRKPAPSGLCLPQSCPAFAFALVLFLERHPTLVRRYFEVIECVSIAI